LPHRCPIPVMSCLNVQKLSLIFVTEYFFIFKVMLTNTYLLCLFREIVQRGYVGPFAAVAAQRRRGVAAAAHRWATPRLPLASHAQEWTGNAIIITNP
jgi:hypothetical protein